MKATYDTDRMRAAATRLRATASELDGIRGLLRGVVAGSVPRCVDDALATFGNKGGDMVRDIGAESKALGGQLDRAAASYEDIDNALVKYFRSGQ